MKRRLQHVKIRILFRLWTKAQDVADWASTKGEEVQKELIGDLILEQTDIQAEFDQMTAA